MTKRENFCEALMKLRIRKQCKIFVHRAIGKCATRHANLKPTDRCKGRRYDWPKWQKEIEQINRAIERAKEWTESDKLTLGIQRTNERIIAARANVCGGN